MFFQFCSFAPMSWLPMKSALIILSLSSQLAIAQQQPQGSNSSSLTSTSTMSPTASKSPSSMPLLPLLTSATSLPLLSTAFPVSLTVPSTTIPSRPPPLALTSPMPTSPPSSASTGPITLIRVALLVPENDTDYGLQRRNSALRNSGGAMTLALERLRREKVLPDNVNFTFNWIYEKCELSKSTGYAYRLIREYQADVIISTPCIAAPPVVGFVAAYYNTPMLVWGQAMVSTLSNSQAYPTLLDVVPNYRNMARMVCEVMNYFQWTFALIVQSDLTGVSGGCLELSRDIDAQVNMPGDQCQLSYKARIFNLNNTDYRAIIQQIKQLARIVAICFDDVRQQRTFALGMFDAGMNKKSYVYLFPDYDMTLALDLSKPPFWQQMRRDDAATLVQDGRDADAEAIGRLGFFLHLDISSNISDMNGFYDRVMAKMHEWPFNCVDCGSKVGENASIYSPLLYDSIYAYGLALAKTFNQSGGQVRPETYRNGTQIANNGKTTFQGMTGTVQIGTDGKRQSIYSLSRRMSKENNNRMEPLLSMRFTDTGTNVTPTNASSTIWATRGGVVPLAVPLCGFDGNGCPISAFDLYKGYIISACALFVIIVVGGISLVFYIIRVRIRDRRLQDQLWQIPSSALTKVKTKHPAERSERSIQSGPSTTSSKFTVQSFLHSKNFGLYTYNQERCIAWRHGSNKVDLSEPDMAELRAMRVLDHDNLNKFFGLSTDGPSLMSIWKFCSRGSIRDVLNNNTLSKDAVFIQSILWELCEGLHFLHNSPIQWHGNLRSTYCLIDERWQVKISYFGLSSLRRFQELKPKDLVWKAPEQLRLADSKGSHAMLEGSKQADVYTLALIMTEVVNMRPCWEEEGDNDPEAAAERPTMPDVEAPRRPVRQPQQQQSHHQQQYENPLHQQQQQRNQRRRRRNAEEICYLVKKGGMLPLRPSIQPAVAEMNPALLHLIRDCWSENPSERPDTAKVRTILRATRESGNTNLMDHVFNLLEQYANTLEQEVQERTRELVEEKKKSDILLYRMLPKQVADRLKLGQSLEPEQYDCVTVFFSDVVGFTAISSRLKPLQVVNLMNELYTSFDGIIGEHDVYKVETIGDGYLCVSGLPRRNGNQHAKECADMSLKLMRSLDSFAIPNMPEERIRLRIGLHSGPCVAGVVGLAMPRYCLFGDTVNTASRMESSSSPNKIHISCETQRFLVEHFEGYVIENRGEVIIKGKGVLQTFWLLGHVSGGSAPIPSSTNIFQPPTQNVALARQFGPEGGGLRRRNSFRHRDSDYGEMYKQYKERVESAGGVREMGDDSSEDGGQAEEERGEEDEKGL